MAEPPCKRGQFIREKTMEELIKKIKRLCQGQKMYVQCKKNYVLMFHKAYYSYRVVLYHKSDILGYSFFVKSFGMNGLNESIKILKQYF